MQYVVLGETVDRTEDYDLTRSRGLPPKFGQREDRRCEKVTIIVARGTCDGIDGKLEGAFRASSSKASWQ